MPHVPGIVNTFDPSLPGSRDIVEVPVATILHSCSRSILLPENLASGRTADSKLHAPRPWRVRVAAVHIPITARQHHPLHCQDMHSTESPVPGLATTITFYPSQCDLLRLKRRHLDSAEKQPPLSWTRTWTHGHQVWTSVHTSGYWTPDASCLAMLFVFLLSFSVTFLRGNGDQLLTIA